MIFLCLGRRVADKERRRLPAAEEPRERLRHFGPQGVSTIELLAVLIGTGHGDDHVLRLAEHLLTHLDGLEGVARASLAELRKIEGVGEAKAARLQAAFELSRRANENKIAERPIVASPRDAADLFMPRLSGLAQEELQVMLLNTRGRVLGMPTLYKGSLNSTVIRPAEIFRPAIIRNAAAIIVAHAHPSGDPTPSAEDIAITRELIPLGKGLDVTVQDHIIVGQNNYVSLRERGIDFT